MGIGRRRFLQQCTQASVALFSISRSSVVISGDEYVNRRLGIAFQKPCGWHYGDVAIFGELRDGQILDILSPEFRQSVVDSAELPILSISRDVLSTNSTTFTPGILVFLENEFEKDVPDESDGEALLRHLSNDVAFNTILLNSFNSISSPALCSISNCPAAEYSASFLFEHRNINPVRVRMKTVIVVHDSRTYTLRIYDSPETGIDLSEEYRQFLRRFRLV